MYKTYIQKATDPQKNITSIYGVTNKHFPDIQLELKELFKRDWAEQQGDQEYIPTTAMFKAYEQDLEFVCFDVTSPADAAKRIKIFLQYLQGSEFSLYSEYHKRGFRCRYVKYDSKAFYREAQEVVVFNVTVKVNNPLSYAIPSLSSNGGLSFTAGGGGGESITIASGGSGFAPGENILTVVQAGASNGAVNATANSEGVITTINSVSTAGYGYVVGSSLATSGGTGTGCLINIVRISEYRISFTTNSATVVYWDDGTNDTYSENTTVNKDFTENGHFGIICPQKL